MYCSLCLQIPKLLVCLTSRLCSPSQFLKCMKLQMLAVPGELLLRRFGEEIRSVVVPAFAILKHNYSLYTANCHCRLFGFHTFSCRQLHHTVVTTLPYTSLATKQETTPKLLPMHLVGFIIRNLTQRTVT